MYDSMGPLFADYEADFGSDESSDKDAFGDKDVDDGGQQSLADMEPEIKETAGNDSEKKKKKMSMLSSMLKTKMSSKGY